MNGNHKAKLVHEFNTTFGIKFVDYFDGFMGLDIVKFDEEFIKPPEGVSTADAVRAKYGDRAVELVSEMISFIPVWEKEKTE